MRRAAKTQARLQPEGKYRLLFDRNPLPMWVCDAETHAFLAVNQAALREYGYSREEFLAMTIKDIQPPEDSPALLEVLAGTPERFYEGAWRHRKKDGTIIDVEITTSSLTFAGRGARLVLANDVTPRGRDEKALRESVEGFRLLVEGVKDCAIVMLDPDGRVVSWTESAERIKGYRAEEILGRHFSCFYPAEDFERGRPENALRAAAIVGRFEDEGWRVRKDGTRFWANVVITALRDEAGRLRGFGKVTRDMTERRQIEGALRESEARMRQMAETIRDVFYLREAATGRILFVNRAFEKVWGGSRQSLGAGSSGWLDTVHPEERERLRSTLEARVRESVIHEWSDEYRIVRPDGAVRWIQDRSWAVRDHERHIVRFAGIAQDITGRRRAEEAIRALSQITHRLSSTLEVEELLGLLVQESLALLGAESACAGVRVPDGMVAHRFFRGSEEVSMASCWRLGEGLTGWVLRHGAPYLTNDAASDPTIVPEIRDRLGVRSAVCSPILDARDEAIGSLEIFNKRDGAGFDARDLEKLTAICEAASLAIQNALAYRDARMTAEALRQAELKYRSIFENAVVGISQTTPDGRILIANPALAHMLGYDSPEDLLTSVTDVGRQLYVDPARRAEGVRVLEERGSMSGFEVEIYRKEGGAIWVSANMRAVRDENGAVRHYESTVTDITERKRAEDSLREVSSRLLRSQSEERRRIARELHDSTAQTLAALAMNLGAIRKTARGLDESLRRKIADSLELARQCCREIRTLSYLLHPPALEEADLWSAMRWYAEGFANRSGIKVDLAFPRRPGRLPETVETALFRIVQESLANIHRHSGSRRARIRVTRNADRVMLLIGDEGHGMPAPRADEADEHAALGVGIAGMRERVRQLGGRFEIDSGRRGTRVRVSLPLERGN